jgi:heme/copper-type cytochrome/quinol oxidase subunit 4
VPFARESGNGWDILEITITIGVILITVTRSIWQLPYSFILMRVAGSRMLVLAGQVGDAHI